MIKNSQKHDNRKTKCIHSIFFKTLLLLTINGIISGQTAPVSIDPEREVIVMFKSGAVIPPANRTEGRLDEFQIPDKRCDSHGLDPAFVVDLLKKQNMKMV